MSELVIDIGAITVEGMPTDKAERVRATVEKAVAEAARKLTGADGIVAVSLGDLRLELGEALEEGAEAEIAHRIEAAVMSAWRSAG